MKTRYMILGLGFSIPIMIVGSKIAIKFALDNHNDKYLSKLGSNQSLFESFIEEVHDETPHFILITSSTRSTAHQAELYRQNKRNARPGRSPHEHSRAIDINIITYDGLIRKRDPKSVWESTGVVKIAEEIGLRWGGNFRNYYDPVHFETRKPG